MPNIITQQSFVFAGQRFLHPLTFVGGLSIRQTVSSRQGKSFKKRIAYYTDFLKQVVVDMDSNPHEVAFYNLDGRSYSHVFQVEASYPFFKGFTLTGAYRLTMPQTTYKGQRMEKPLTSKYKGLLTASYQTPLGIWRRK